MPNQPSHPDTNSTASAPPATPLSWQQALHDLFTDRCTMVGIESRQALRDLISRLVLATLATGLTLLGWLIAMAALIAHLSAISQLPWWLIGYATALCHAILGLLLLHRLKSKTCNYYPHTRNEFEKDRTWILNLTQPRSKP